MKMQGQLLSFKSKSNNYIEKKKIPGVIASIIASITFKLFSASRTCAGVICLNTHRGELIKASFHGLIGRPVTSQKLPVFS